MHECSNCRWVVKDYDSFHCRKCMEDIYINGNGFTGWTSEKEVKTGDKFVQWYSGFGEKFRCCSAFVLVGKVWKALHL